ncbi:ABC transporter permease [Sporolactobacillus sp. CPB3-1]|uniref:ABC transporter permease n=1 Tax=Sporolactobacillus mangiferae TaxID=2940498 RepID=A0ABT0MDH5_9BACL|nr:ABC transporter permease [Sporolactobacillus mangiferae]MCL1632638.1 ABC transporter permease [Sporolactobacillus mangiferae]
MNKFILLFSQSYTNKLKTKSFLLTTLLLLVGLLCLFMWPTISNWFSSEGKQLKIAISDQTHSRTAAYFHSTNQIRFTSSALPYNQEEQRVLKGKEDGLLILSRKQDGSLKAELRTQKPLELTNQKNIEEQVRTANRLFTIEQLNLNSEQVQKIMNQEIDLQQTVLSKNDASGKSSAQKATATIVSYAVALIIYLFVLSYLSIISSEIAAEKDSRIMEIIISSTSPIVHLLSRVFGTLFLAMTQFAILIGSALIMARSFHNGKYWTQISDLMGGLTPGYTVYAILFFLLACLLYTLVGAVLGSLVNKVQDVGQAMMPVTMMLMIGFFIAISGMSNPDTLLIKIFSYVPFTASMIMPMRIGATDMALWQAFLSLMLLFITIIGLFVFSLRFYRGSVLTYASGSFIKKIKQAIQLSK